MPEPFLCVVGMPEVGLRRKLDFRGIRSYLASAKVKTAANANGGAQRSKAVDGSELIVLARVGK